MAPGRAFFASDKWRIKAGEGNATAASAFDVLVESLRSPAMKRIYKKPTLVKHEKLTRLTAQIIASGVVLGE
ncbi:hypothetical protein C9427_24845 [Mesorhizobium helmanticense]|uniref:Uncharacterized protein n=1 Tax=Mesorhizobium helmanticense TaxID=1776423 RepID=A0A2T4IPW9_9HYPH|nr:hypothetical protein C9427_24845 [Mesorhizobium helmanticense]